MPFLFITLFLVSLAPPARAEEQETALQKFFCYTESDAFTDKERATLIGKNGPPKITYIRDENLTKHEREGTCASTDGSGDSGDECNFGYLNDQYGFYVVRDYGDGQAETIRYIVDQFERRPDDPVGISAVAWKGKATLVYKKRGFLEEPQEYYVLDKTVDGKPVRENQSFKEKEQANFIFLALPPRPT